MTNAIRGMTNKCLMRRNNARWLFLAFLTISASPAHSDMEVTQKPANVPTNSAAKQAITVAKVLPKPEPPKPDPITVLLKATDPSQQQKGIDAIKELFAENAASTYLKYRTEWLDLLMKTQHYKEVLEFSMDAILNAAGDMIALEGLQKANVMALIALDKQEEALSSAKSYFNIATMKGTAEAIMAVVQCLNMNPSPDMNRLERFKAQQLVNSNSVSALKELAGGPSVLGSIQVNAAPFEKAIRKRTSGDFQSLTERGNLLLLADRPKEAREAFERAYVVADDSKLATASENLARAMKAEDGNVARANAWVLSIRPPPPPPPKPAPAPAPAVQPVKVKTTNGI